MKLRKSAASRADHASTRRSRFSVPSRAQVGWALGLFVVLSLLAAKGYESYLIRENRLDRRTEKFAYRKGYEMAQDPVFIENGNIFDHFPANEAAREPNDFFTAVGMVFPASEPHGEVGIEYTSVLQDMSQAPPKEHSQLIQTFVNSYNAGWRDGTASRPSL